MRMNEVDRKKILSLFLWVMLWCIGTNNMAAAEDRVETALPTFPVVLNGVTIEQENNQYPLLVYKDITYIAMTYHNAQLLGLSSNWTQTNGLVIDKKSSVSDQKTIQNNYKMTKSKSRNQAKYTAIYPNFTITINGKTIDNRKEKYPLLVFRDVTYFPLTWRYAVDEFGWTYTFDNNNGLNITPVFSTPELDSSFIGTDMTDHNAIAIVTGDAVNLRKGAGTDYDVVGQANKGMVLTVLDGSQDTMGKVWYYVETKSGLKGWIASWFVSINDKNGIDLDNGNINVSTNIKPAIKDNIIYVTGDVVNLRSGSGTNYSQQGQVKKGDELTIIDSSKDRDGKVWYKVEQEKEAAAWIASWLTSTTNPINNSNMPTVSTGTRTTLELQGVVQDDKKTIITLKNGAGNTYSIEKVNANTLQLLLNNVDLDMQIDYTDNGFDLTASEIGNGKVRLTLGYSLGDYASIEQEDSCLILNCYHTGSSLAGRTIVLDPGHGGIDAGGVGYTMKSVTDADIGYTVALKLKTLLENAGANVILTRGDLAKTERVRVAERMEINNGVEPDIFISIHGNSSEGVTKATGAETYTYNGKIYSQQYLSENLAQKICDGIGGSTGRKSVVKKANFYVLRLNNHPSVLVETGYLNNLEDEKLLATDMYRQMLAEGIYQGIVNYLSQF